MMAVETASSRVAGATADPVGGAGRPGPTARSGRRGFTLIELLVVIAILSLLVSILAPTLRQAKELARDAACRANLHGIAMALKIYAADSDGYYPTAAAVAGSPPPNDVWHYSPWKALYTTGCIEDRNVWDCPADETREPNDWDGWLMHPSVEWAGDFNRAYAYEWSAGMYDGRLYPKPMYQEPYLPEQDPNPAGDQIVFDFENGDPTVNNHAYVQGHAQFAWTWGDRPKRGADAYRHLESLNIAAGDGHVESYAKIGEDYATSDLKWPSYVSERIFPP